MLKIEFLFYRIILQHLCIIYIIMCLKRTLDKLLYKLENKKILK